jgi:hypothetical protein
LFLPLDLRKHIGDSGLGFLEPQGKHECFPVGWEPIPLMAALALTVLDPTATQDESFELFAGHGVLPD